MSKQYNPADFCSMPGVTMEQLRKEAADDIRMQVSYLMEKVADAKKMGLIVYGPAVGEILVDGKSYPAVIGPDGVRF